MRRSDPRAGFTLVEVLAALVITAAFAAVVLPFAGRLAGRWWIGESRVEMADGWMQAIARLSDDLAQAVPIVQQRKEGVAVSFKAGPDILEFIRPALATSARPTLETVRFDIRQTSRGNALLRRTGWFQPGSGTEFGGPTTLFDGPAQLRFRAFGSDLVPRTTWVDLPEMPAGVELQAVGPVAGETPPVPILLRIVSKAVTKTTSSIYDTQPP